ncbi:MAG TPA: nitroreductase family deazaflavin-dependent oxidoreductase [Pseudomonadales bacterium]
MARRLREPRPLSAPIKLLLRSPLLLYRAGLGQLLGSRFLLLEHIGRNSGRIRRTVLEVVQHERSTDVFYVAVGFGPRSDWYRNLLADPDCIIQVGRRRSRRRARVLPAAEGAELMARYARRHPRAARALMRMMGFEVDGSEADYRDVAGRLGLEFVALEPRGRGAAGPARGRVRG